MKKIIKIFKQVKVNVPLLDAIEQVPSNAIFLKDLCRKKRALEKVFLTVNISGIIQNNLLVKCNDPGYLTIFYIIRTIVIAKALLDSGASVNFLSIWYTSR